MPVEYEDTPVGRLATFIKNSQKTGTAAISLSNVTSAVPSTTTYIIPEQTLTASDFELVDQHDNIYQYEAPLTSSFPTFGFNDGDKAVLNDDGYYYDFVFANIPADFLEDIIGEFYNEDIPYGIVVYADHYVMMLRLVEEEMSEDFSMTLSLYTSTPEVEPKWKKSDDNVIEVTGFINYDSNFGVGIYEVNMTEEEFISCFKRNTRKPLYFFVPAELDPSTEGYEFLYDDDEPECNRMYLVESLDQKFTSNDGFQLYFVSGGPLGLVLVAEENAST